MADGFRGAAYMRGGGEKSNDSILKGWLQKTSLGAARFVQREIRSELKHWEDELERSDATPEWIDEREREKVAEIVRTHTKLQPFQGELKKLLHCRHHYKASILIASKQFGVRARSLERKPVFPF